MKKPWIKQKQKKTVGKRQGLENTGSLAYGKESEFYFKEK